MTALFDQGPPPPCPQPFNMAAHVLQHAADLGDKIALAIVSPAGAERWSYARLEAAVRGTAAGFLAMGLAPGDKVLMRLGNTVDFPITFLACLAVDLIPVPTSSQLTAREVDKIAAEIAPRLVVAGEGIAVPGNAPCPVIYMPELERHRTDPPADYAMGDPERLGYIIYTSGTSGVPRAVAHAHRAIWARQMMFEGWYGLRAQDRLLHAGAFNWTYTLGTGLMDPWTIGATALIPAAGVGSDALALLLKRYDATIFAAAPGVYRQVLRQHPDGPLSLPKLRHGLSAGEKLPDRVRDAWNAATGTRIYEAYGMSECSTFISGSPAHPAPQASSGYPQAGRRVAVLGDDGAPVGYGEPGMLAVSNRDPGLMLGYLDAPEETAARFSGEWFLTGDTGAMAEDGAITYLGRGDDMMNAGGYRVSPLEVEAVLNAHPDIHESAAAEVLVKADTTVIAAFYTADRPLDPDALAAYAGERLARYKCPRLFEQVPDLPRGANNKILRRALRARYEATHDPA